MMESIVKRRDTQIVASVIIVVSLILTPLSFMGTGMMQSSSQSSLSPAAAAVDEAGSTLAPLPTSSTAPVVAEAQPQPDPVLTFAQKQTTYFSPPRPVEYPDIGRAPQRHISMGSASTIAHAKEYLNNMNDGHNAPRPLEPLSEDIWQYYDLAYGWKRMSREQIKSCANNRLSRPHIAFVGDSIMRGSFDRLMERYGESPVVTDPNHDFQMKTVTFDGVTMTFKFLTGVTTGKRAINITHWLVNPGRKSSVHNSKDPLPPAVGAIVYNSAIWDFGGVSQRQGDWEMDGVIMHGDPFLPGTRVISRYMTALSQFALATENIVPSDVRLIWRLATPVSVKKVEQSRGSFYSNLKLRLLNRVAEDILTPAGFEFVNPQPLWDAGFDHFSSEIVHQLWSYDGFHPPSEVADMIMDMMLNKICGRPTEKPWGRDSIQYLSTMNCEVRGDCELWQAPSASSLDKLFT